MHIVNYWPEQRDPHPCWHCHHFLGMVSAGTAARCSIGGRTSIKAAPARGCAIWEREPGSDDEPGPPDSAGVSLPLKRLPVVHPVVKWAP